METCISVAPCNLHGRSALLLCSESAKLASQIYLEKLSLARPVNAKSLSGLLSLALKQGELFRISVHGPESKMDLSRLQTIFCLLSVQPSISSVCMEYGTR